MRQGALSPFIEVLGTIAGLLAAGASVPFLTKGKVYIWGYNDMTTKQKMCIQWVVTDPDGIVAEDYGPDWTFEYVNPNEDHRFYGDQFDINKPGTWAIAIDLLMNPDSPVIVDSYAGVLCVVKEEIYAGHISQKELEYDSVRGTIPVY